MANTHKKKKTASGVRRDIVSVATGIVLGVLLGSIVGLSGGSHMARITEKEVDDRGSRGSMAQRIEDRRQERLQLHYRQIRNVLGGKVLPDIVIKLSPLLTVISDEFISGHREPTQRHTAAPEVAADATDFPAFDHASWPVGKTPNWGKMRTPEEWNRTFREMTAGDFVSLPRYDLSILTTPLKEYVARRNESIAEITAKLFYSTRHFAAYDLDAGEFTAIHPGVDLKLALGTPIGSVGGGRVNAVLNSEYLGTHVIVEHRIGNETFYSIYAHLGSTSVQKGDSVKPGDTLGTVGMTGNTNGPHLHFQIDRGEPGEAQHTPYRPGSLPGRAEADKYTVHPIEFIQEHRS